MSLNDKISFIAFLINLLTFQVKKTVTGKCTETMERVTWDVIEFYGQKAQIQLVDNSSYSWGHINFDDLKGDITCVWGKFPYAQPGGCEMRYQSSVGDW